MPNFIDMPFLAEFSLSDNIHKSPAGFLICQNVPFAKVGVQEYLGREIGLKDRWSEIVKVYRLREDVEKSLPGFEGMPVTDDHPGPMLEPSNVGNFTKGHAQNVRMDGDLAVTDFMIIESNLIEKVENKTKRGVSAGYTAKLVPYKDGYKQVDITGNHIAIVSKGRAGPVAVINDHELTIGERKPMKPEEIRAQMLASFVKDANPSAADLAQAMKLLDEEADEKKEAKDEAEKEEKEDAETKDKSLLDKAFSIFQKDKAADKQAAAFADALNAINGTLTTLQADVKTLKDAKEDAEEKETTDEEGEEDEGKEAKDEDMSEETATTDSAIAALSKELAPYIAKLSDAHAKPIKDALTKATGRKPSTKKAYSAITKTVNNHKNKQAGWNPFTDAASGEDDGSKLGEEIKAKFNAQCQKQA